MSEFYAFITESNRIEGITRAPFASEIEAMDAFMELPAISVLDLQKLVHAFAPNHVLRDNPGLDVRVGNYIAPPGGPMIRSMLEFVLAKVNMRAIDAYNAHCDYESLHPFTDGNGRSGRALWLWQMRRDGDRLAELPFLHAFYYQSLSHLPERA